MKTCFNCGIEIGGLKKLFCSRKCKESSRWKRMSEEDRILARAINRQKYSENREERLTNKRRYYEERKEEIKAKNSKYRKENSVADKKYGRGDKGRYRDYKKGASSRGKTFELTSEQFASFRDLPCSYCGDTFDGVGIDRVDNTIGYTMENSVSCCPMCNRMKHAFTLKEFLEKCHKISKKHYTT